jgi:hypothetical protein
MRRALSRFAPPIVVGLVAFTIRLVYLWSVRGTPVVDVLLVDSETYDRFARLILGGAFHGEQVFSMNALYPYALAAAYALGHGSVMAALLAQGIMDSVSCVLIWWIGRACFSPVAGVVAGLAGAVYGPMVFYSGALLTPTLVTFLGLVALALLVRYGARPSWPVALAAGFALGLAILGRGNNLLFAGLGLAWIAVAAPSRGSATRHAAAFLAAALAPGVVVTLRNFVAEGHLVPIAANYAAFYIGHNPQATGLYAVPGFTTGASFEREVLGTPAAVAGMVGHPVTLAESSSFLFREGLRFIAAHPFEELRLAAAKFFYF